MNLQGCNCNKCIRNSSLRNQCIKPDSIRNDSSSLEYACNYYTLYNDAYQCLQSRLQNIYKMCSDTNNTLLSDDTTLKKVRRIAFGLRLLHRLVELYNSVQVSKLIHIACMYLYPVFIYIYIANFML